MKTASASARKIVADPVTDDRAAEARFAALIRSDRFSDFALACLNQGVREAVEETAGLEGKQRG